MSHLSTLIRRVINESNKEFQTKEDREYFAEKVLNLREYIESWDDYTEQELVEAYILYSAYQGFLPDEDNQDIKLEGHNSSIIDEIDMNRV